MPSGLSIVSDISKALNDSSEKIMNFNLAAYQLRQDRELFELDKKKKNIELQILERSASPEQVDLERRKHKAEVGKAEADFGIAEQQLKMEKSKELENAKWTMEGMLDRMLTEEEKYKLTPDAMADGKIEIGERIALSEAEKLEKLFQKGYGGTFGKEGATFEREQQGEITGYSPEGTPIISSKAPTPTWGQEQEQNRNLMMAKSRLKQGGTWQEYENKETGETKIEFVPYTNMNEAEDDMASFGFGVDEPELQPLWEEFSKRYNLLPGAKKEEVEQSPLSTALQTAKSFWNRSLGRKEKTPEDKIIESLKTEWDLQDFLDKEKEYKAQGIDWDAIVKHLEEQGILEK